MGDVTHIKQAIRTMYAARVAGNLDGTMAGFADDAVFQFNSDGADLPGGNHTVSGKKDIRPLMAGLIDSFRFKNWKEISLIAEGDQAALHWQAYVDFVHVGRAAHFDVFDFMTFRDGKIVRFRQSTDTAKMKSLASAVAS